MNLMLIETATGVCSVAMATDGRVTELRESSLPNAHSTLLPLFVRDLMPRQLDGVCVSAGPGSYTGLRIGVSTAKGICYARNIPLLSVPTLQAMASLYFEEHPAFEGVVCPMIDARRMECYTMLVGREGVLRETQADVVEEGIYDRWLDQGEVMFVGNGAEKTREILGKHPNARYDDSFAISARGLLGLAMQKWQRGETEDVAYFEPFYLKDFVAKKSVVHGLRD